MSKHVGENAENDVFNIYSQVKKRHTVTPSNIDAKQWHLYRDESELDL